ncbi:MAG: hypothetical protein II897_03860 [Clostridia bacterium]|nr:hypothetical protein [Clostridia bacterium]
MDEERRIEVVELPVGQLRTGFGNPRKIAKKKKDKLRQSLEDLGDFGSFVIDENDNLIAGNQRASILKEKDPDTRVLCKRLIGYTDAEKRAINIKDNTHEGEWDLDLLADWTADLNMSLGIDPKSKNIQDRKIPQMELIRYEKYNYVMIVCRNEVDYLNLQRLLGIEGGKVLIAKRRKIKGRAIWFDDIKAQIIPKKEEDNKGGDTE